MWQLMIVQSHITITSGGRDEDDEIRLGEKVSEQTLRTTAMAHRNMIIHGTFSERELALRSMGKFYKNVDTGEERLLVTF